MKSTVKYSSNFIALCFFLGTFVSLSQNSNIDWSAESNLITVHETQRVSTSNLIKQGSTFIWEQVNEEGLNTITFNIISSTGNWDETNHIGELNYGLSVLNGTTTASVTVLGTTEGVSIELILHGVAISNESYTFHVDVNNLTNL